jgi:predicted RNA methylase
MTGSADAVHRSNADAWNETSDWYARRADELREHMAAGGSTLHPQEHKLLKMLPPLDSWCELAVHLQCAAGFDTISLTSLGARQAIGVDISTDLIRIATTLGEQLRAPVTFLCADVLQVRGLEGEAD